MTRALVVGHRGRAQTMAMCLQARAARPIERAEMSETPRPITRANGAIQVEHCDVPGEMTLADWRRERAKRAAVHTARPARRSVRRTLADVFRRAA
jgi:hypothetical protein